MAESSNKNYSILEQQLLDECRAMAQYALTQGFVVPAPIIEALSKYDKNRAIQVTCPRPEPLPAGEGKDSSMDSSKETAVPTIMADCRQPGQPGELALLHARLVRIISPVKPNMAVMIVAHESSRKLFKFLGPVSLIREMMFISIFSLIAMFCVSLNPLVNGDPNNFSLMKNSGYSLFYNQMFLICAASIGASFNALFVADKYARAGIWNPSYETSYWIRYVLGVLSGAMLATLIPIEDIDPQTKMGSMKGFGAPILSLLGGVSSNVVYQMLSRLAETLESLVSGGIKEKLDAQEKTSNVRIMEETSRQRMLIIAKLAKLQYQFSATSDPAIIMQELDRLHRELLTPGSADEFLDSLADSGASKQEQLNEAES